eukprot:TRINITY_DN45962_c0_g1_i1.p1 TRINITY_DN45962_c0_g1~~TRINITY_DN45962_c0_g1_i1.p1  ORF type:complete len:256 (-),score=25.51 TRINITY_DN45962_c0_g1_i1:361-1128(-)
MVGYCCNNGFQGMYMCTDDSELTSVTLDWLRDVAPIFDGDLTCCQKAHPGGEQCDREYLVPTALAMYTDMLWKHGEGQLPEDFRRTLWPVFQERRDTIFPKTFWYARRGARGTRRLLFGSMMKKVAEFASAQTVTEEELGNGSASLDSFRLANGRPPASSPVARQAVWTTVQQRLRSMSGQGSGRQSVLEEYSGRQSATGFGSVRSEKRARPRALHQSHSDAQLRRIQSRKETRSDINSDRFICTACDDVSEVSL